MDVAKAVGVTAKYGGSITEYEGAHKVPGSIIPLIAIPTTAGTGSEVTAFSVITDHSRDYKLTVFSYEILPAYAILDAELLTISVVSLQIVEILKQQSQCLSVHFSQESPFPLQDLEMYMQ